MPNNQTLCSCASGITTGNCCAAPTSPAANNSNLNTDQATAEFKRGNHQASSQLCIAILEQNNQHFDALRLLQRYHALQGNQQTSGVLLKRLNLLRMDDIGTTCDLTLHYLDHSDINHAYQHARNAIRLAPDYSQSQNLMGLTLTKMNRLAPGEHHFRQALELRGPTEALCANLGLNLKRQGKIAAAESFYLQSLKLAPDNLTTLIGLINLYEVSRDFTNAWQWLDRAKALRPNNPQVRLTEAKLLQREKRYEEGLVLLDAEQDELKQPHWRQRAELLDKLGRYPEAFHAHQTANQEALKSIPATQQYNVQLANRHAKELGGFFVKKRVATLPKIQQRISDKPQPIFIIGFPRSGTTLTEQILSSHSNINAGDELQFIHELAQIAPNLLASNLPYPRCFADLWLGENLGALEAFHDYYLRKAEQIGLFEGDVSWFTDKMPLNEMHLGLISLIFPKSPVLHLIRHPLDVVLSTYFNDLSHGFNCAAKLETAATHYMLVRDLIDHYLEALSINYRPLKYEQLVANQEQQTRDLLTWIGEPWQPGCLNFHQSERYARTASYAQVTEKLYSHSTFRYRNYLEQLKPIIPILEPAIIKLGYTIEQPV